MERTISMLLAVVVLAFPAIASGQECPVAEPVPASNVVELGLRVWPLQRGRSPAWSRAVDDVGNRVTGLSAGASQEFETGELPAETIVNVGLTIALGDVVEKRQELYRKRGVHDAANLDRDAFDFVMSLHAIYGSWWSAERERAHLTEYVEEFGEEVERFESAAERGMVSKVDVEDVRAELSRLQGELTEAKLAADVALENLHTIVGQRCAYAAPEPTATEPTTTTTTTTQDDNVWSVLLGAAQDFPELRVERARMEMLRADAAASDASQPWQLGVGAQMRMERFESLVVGPTLSLTIPFTNWSAPEARVSELSAERAERLAERTNRVLVERIRSRARMLEARKSAVDSWRQNVVAPLQQRVELYEAAHQAGEVSTFRLVNARGSLHEAEHALLNLRTSVERDLLTAEAVRNVLEQLATGVEQ